MKPTRLVRYGQDSALNIAATVCSFPTHYTAMYVFKRLWLSQRRNVSAISYSRVVHMCCACISTPPAPCPPPFGLRYPFHPKSYRRRNGRLRCPLHVLRVVVAPPDDDQVFDAPADVQLALPKETEVASFEVPVSRSTVARHPFRLGRVALTTKKQRKTSMEMTGRGECFAVNY